VLGLKRSALGVRFLLSRWQRLLKLINEEGTLYGSDRSEYINYQGARITCPEDLFHSEGAYLTYLFCLMCKPVTKDEEFVAMGNASWMPAGLMDRDPKEWLGETSVCRKLLVELAEREIALLIHRESVLREHHETPARDSAEVRKQVLASPLGMALTRLGDLHQRQFNRAYNAFLKGRAYSEKTGRLPGAPIPGLHGEPHDTRGSESDRVSRAESAEALRRQRKQAAETLAPGPENGIGPAIADSDVPRAAAVAAWPDYVAKQEAASRGA
jgi:hypothetical protein